MTIDAGELTLILGALGTLVAVVLGAIVAAVAALSKARTAFLQSKQAARRDELEVLRQTIDFQAKRIAEFHTRLDEQIAENDALRRMNVELMKVNTELQLKVTVLDESVKTLQAQLVRKDKEIAELHGELDALSRKAA